MYDLADFAMGMSPMERQRMEAQLLRRRQAGAALEDANRQGNQFNNMAAIANMANNPGVVDAAGMAAKNAQARFKPIQMGNQGFTIPATGEFVASPIYEDEQRAARQARADQARSTADAAMERARMEEAGRRDRADQRNALGMVMAEIARIRADQAGAARADKAAKAAEGKTLPGSEIRRLTDKEGLASGFNELANSFKDEYSGTTFIAKGENLLGKFQPLGIGASYGDQSNWWQNYNDRKNAIRHELFGSALTATEKAAFDAANIEEGMAPAEIKRRLAQQAKAVAGAYNKLKRNFGRGGYNISNFEDLPIVDAPVPGGKPPASSNDDALINKYLTR